MPKRFNELEIAVLNWFRDHYMNLRLSEQLDSVTLVKRRWTKVGFYIDLKVHRNTPMLELDDFDGHWPINGPNLESPDIQSGGGSILWGKDGHISCLEMYAFGDFFREHVSEFKLSP
jgi:hypothetical protein